MAHQAADPRPEIQFHDDISARWEDLHRSPTFLRRTRAMFDLLKGVDLTGQSWIDAGCGTGVLSRRLAERGCTVTGYDASDEMLSVARRPVATAHTGNAIAFEKIETIERLPSADQSRDGILCASVLEYVPAPSACLVEFSRVVRPGGLILLSVPNQRSMVRMALKIAHRLSAYFLPSPAFRYLQHSIYEFSLASITVALSDAGFDIVTHNYAGSPLPTSLDGSGAIGTLINVLARRREDEIDTTRP